MEKRVAEFTYQDLTDYGNKRTCDGNWSMQLAMVFLAFYHSIPKPFFNRTKKRNTYVKEHIGDLFNLENYPNMAINIETGKINLGLTPVKPGVGRDPKTGRFVSLR